MAPTPEEVTEALRRLQSELERNGPAIAEILADDALIAGHESGSESAESDQALLRRAEAEVIPLEAFQRDLASRGTEVMDGVARGPSGKLRNFRAMGQEKLEGVRAEALWETPVDHKALVAIEAELDRRAEN